MPCRLCGKEYQYYIPITHLSYGMIPDYYCEDCFINFNYSLYRNPQLSAKEIQKYIKHKRSEMEELKDENKRLCEEIKRLQTMIDYQPGGSGYVDAKQSFNSLAEVSNY